MKEIIIREMKDSDWKEVKKIYQQGIDSGISTFMRKVPEFEYWNNSKLKIGRLVAIYDGKIVGWIVLSPTSAREEYSGVCEISVYIHQDYKRMGIGRKLIEKEIEVSEQNNIWTLQSVMLGNNIPSMKLHESCGFRVVGYREKVARDKNGEWQNTFLMERRSKVIF